MKTHYLFCYLKLFFYSEYFLERVVDTIFYQTNAHCLN